MTKRLFDIAAAAAGLVVSSPLLVIAAVAIRLNGRGPVLFRQTRVGRHFVPFTIYKLRTMAATPAGPALTSTDDPRITRVGRVLRRLKIDELPQLVNVLRGDMSLVGPRPEVPRYVEMFRGDYAEVLTVRPGITDLASIEFRHEGELLAASADAEHVYVTEILPAKIRLAKRYVAERTFRGDLVIIMRTFAALAR